MLFSPILETLEIVDVNIFIQNLLMTFQTSYILWQIKEFLENNGIPGGGSG